MLTHASIFNTLAFTLIFLDLLVLIDYVSRLRLFILQVFVLRNLVCFLLKRKSISTP